MMPRLAITRRSALKAAALGVAGFPAILRSGHAQGLQHVKITLPWLPEGSYAYAFVAKARGAWKERGLDVEIARGYGSLTAAQATVEGQFDAAISNASAVILLATKGADLRSLAIMDYEPTMGIAVLEGSPIRTPKDLEGRKVGQTISSADAAFFAPFCAKNGVDIKTVQVVNMDARVRNQALRERRVDAITGFASSFLAALGSAGTKLRFMLYSDYGLFLYGNMGLLVPPRTLDEKPEFCRNLTEGLLEGLKYTITEPAAAEGLFLDQVTELKMMANAADFARIGIAVQRFGVISVPDAKINGLGWSDPGKLDQMADFVMEYQADPGARKPDVPSRFLNRFTGGVRLSDAEWDAAVKDTQGVAKQLRKEG